MSASSPQRRLGVGGKLAFALGDHSVNVALSSLALVFLFFLTDVAGLEPATAGWVVLLSRIVDAVSDPFMGRLSDRTRTRLGRRRPYFLAGALPLGIAYALLWRTPFAGQFEMAAYYTLLYMAVSLSLTVLSVPYMALLPEMALGYQERTSVNAYRNVFTVFGTMLSASIPVIVEALGGGKAGFAMMGLCIGIWLSAPWPVVFAASFERSEIDRSDDEPLLTAVSDLARHVAFLRLGAMYLLSRIALDLASLSFFYYFRYWLERPEQTTIALLTLLLVVVAVHPALVALNRTWDKHHLFTAGSVWWIAIALLMFFAQPDWPGWTIFALAAALGFGYAGVDLTPWSMLGEVIDEGELRTGARRDGIYNGYFTFVRKAGGGMAGFLAGQLLQVTGYITPSAEMPSPEQPDSALLAIRCLLTVGPVLFLIAGAAFSLGYPLTRARHTEIQQSLAERREALAHTAP